MPLGKMLKQIRDKTVEIEARHAAAREANRVRAVIDQDTIEDLEGLRHLTMDFYQHQYKYAVLEHPEAPVLPEHEVWRVIEELIERQYTGGLRGALRAVRLGVDGGILGLVEKLYELIRSQHVKACHRYIVMANASPVDWDARVAVAREFLRSLSCVVPGEQQIRPEELAPRPRLEEIITKHIQRTSLSHAER